MILNMDCVIYIIVLTISANFSCVAGYDTWIRYMSESKILKPGSNANITCDFNAKIGSYYRKWIKIEPGGVKVHNISLNDKVEMADKRYSVKTFLSLRDPRSFRMYSLEIVNVSSEDTGIYECQIYLTNGSIAIKRSSLYIFPHELITTVLEGDDAHVSCFPENYFPIFDVSWSKDTFPEGSSIENGTVVIPSAVSNDSGIYNCRAMFHFNDTDQFKTLRTFSRIIVLDVVPPLSVKVRNNVLIRPPGYNVNLTVLVRSISPISVTWFRNDKPLNTSANPIQMLLYDVDSSKRTLKVASLLIKNITFSSYGQYYCQVDNEFHSIITNVILKKPLV